MKQVVGLVLVVALALTMTACSPGASGTVKITQAEQGKTVDAKVGDTLIVSLEGNPSTGYTWVARDLPSFLTQEGEPTFTKSGNSGVVGAPGMLETKFKGTAAGSSDLVLDYKRPWETTATPAKTFSTAVTVK